MLMEVHNSLIPFRAWKEKREKKGGGEEGGEEGNSLSPQQYLALIKYTGDTKPK